MSEEIKGVEQIEDPKDKIRRVLDDVEQQGSEIAHKGRELTSSGQFAVDFAQLAKEILPYLRPGVDVEYFLDDLIILRDHGDALIGTLGAIHSKTYVSTSSTAYVSASGCFCPRKFRTSIQS